MSQSEPIDSAYLGRLSGLMQVKFSREELIHLARSLGVEHEDIPSETRPQFTRELVGYFHRREHLSDLLNALQRVRPAISWTNLSEQAELAALSPNDLMQL